MTKLLTVYNNIYKTGRVPESFKRSIVYPLHKKGDVNSVENYRGLSFIDCIGKVFISLVNNRLINWVNHKGLLTEFQAGFRKGYSTIDNIFNLTNIAHLQLTEKRGKLFTFFVDFSSASDTIDREALIFKMSCMGLSTKFLKMLGNYYQGTTAAVWCREGVTNHFDTSMGLRQGCICSPTNFAIFINDLTDVLQGGCYFGETRVNVLMYADDIVLLSPTATGLQHMINRLENYCETWNLRVNLSKSKIMVFRRGGRLGSGSKWWYKGKEIEIVNSYKYLGVNFTSTLSWELHFKEKSSASKFAVNSIW